MNMSNIAVQELAVQAVLERDREAAFHACALDPLTAAVVPLPRIREMFEELWVAEATAWLTSTRRNERCALPSPA